MATVGILTISTKGAAGEREDASGEVIREMVTAPPSARPSPNALSSPTTADAIEEILRRWADESAA